MLNKNLSMKRELKWFPLQGIKDLVPLHHRSLGWNARSLFFRGLVGYSSKELEAKEILDAGNIVRSED